MHPDLPQLPAPSTSPHRKMDSRGEHWTSPLDQGWTFPPGQASLSSPSALMHNLPRTRLPPRSANSSQTRFTHHHKSWSGSKCRHALHNQNKEPDTHLFSSPHIVLKQDIIHTVDNRINLNSWTWTFIFGLMSILCMYNCTLNVLCYLFSWSRLPERPESPVTVRILDQARINVKG